MRILALGLVLAITACDDKPTKTSGTVGPAGGTVQLGNSAVDIPAGALASPVEIAIREANGATPPIGTDPVGRMLQFLPEGQLFAQPVTLRLAVDLEALPVGRSVADVVVFTAPAGDPNWAQLFTFANGSDGVRVEVSHFSLFVPVVAKIGVDLSGPMDFAVDVGDMSLAPVDLGARDLADRDAACSRSYMMNTTSCSLNLASSCDGHTYQLSCSTSDMSIWDCVCSKDGSTTKMFLRAQPTVGSVCSQANLTSDWTSQCAYPM